MMVMIDQILTIIITTLRVLSRHRQPGSNHGTSRAGRQTQQAWSLIGSPSPGLQSPVLLLIVYGFHSCSVLGCFKMQLTAVMM